MQKGFTLIELMMVIVILGILAAISIPAYQNYIARTQLAEALSLMSAVKAQVSEFYGLRNECADNNTVMPGYSAGLAKPTQISGKYVDRVWTGKPITPAVVPDGAGRPLQAQCEIAARMKKTGISQGIADKVLILSMATTSGAFIWKCGVRPTTDIIPKQYLPQACQD